MHRPILAFIGIAMAGSGWLQAAGQQGSGNAPAPASSQRAVLNRYCVTCHNEKAHIAGLMLDKADVDKAPDSAEISLPPGKFEISLKFADGASENREFEFASDETWGLLAGLTGVMLPVRLY